MPPMYQVGKGSLLLLLIVYVILYFRIALAKVCEIMDVVCGIPL